ncbi:MAG: NAD-dependent deacetylase [Gemmatimonadetes bacterium]|nr:NAD-dependent deacetylase [Gemmatimonadota bacterium]MBT7862226.1 NAD-dependent deacetylase [Gemmatimonadota bacterium]
MTPPSTDARLVELLAATQHLLLFTGAGISTTSGIPDFRGPDGVWKRRQPVYFDDFLRSEEARIEHWDFKLEAWPALRNAGPTPVHDAIADLERAGRVEMVVTQNIDGLHSRAGTSDQRLVEIHGTNTKVECLTCGDRSDPQAHFDAFAATRRPPRCTCGGLLKPATISFGQSLIAADLDRASEAATRADCVIALGSTLSVYPAATIPLSAAETGAPYVIINQGETDHDRHAAVTLRLEGDVQTIFAPAVAMALGIRGHLTIDPK